MGSGLLLEGDRQQESRVQLDLQGSERDPECFTIGTAVPDSL
jgi:hypothetical protein